MRMQATREFHERVYNWHPKVPDGPPGAQILTLTIRCAYRGGVDSGVDSGGLIERGLIAGSGGRWDRTRLGGG